MDLEDRIVELLTSPDSDVARKFFRAWDEERSASWATANLQARKSAASEGHIRALRGQLRHQFGEDALAKAAKTAGVGHFAKPTEKPGAHMMLARVGKFALTSVKVNDRELLPRGSLTRSVLSRANQKIMPQLDMLSKPEPESVTELAFFGCLLAVPSTVDHSAPYGLYLAVPDNQMTGWIKTLSIETLHAMILNRQSGKDASKAGSAKKVEDNAIPQIRLSKQDKSKSADE